MGSRSDDDYWNNKYDKRWCADCGLSLDYWNEDYCDECEPEEEEEDE